MSLYVSEFLELFRNDEVKTLNIDTDGIKKEIFIRRLSYQVCAKYRYKCQQMVYRSEYDAMINSSKANFAFFKEDVEVSEFYLLRKSLCDADGKLIFTDDTEAQFQMFVNNVTDDIACSLVMEILKFNHIISEDDLDDDDKKKVSPIE